MPYDKYREWPVPSRLGANLPYPPGVIPGGDIKGVVLQDLGLPKDDIDRLEILDSFEAWVKRCHQAEMAKMTAAHIVAQAHPIIESGILGQFPPISPLHRGRPSQP